MRILILTSTVNQSISVGKIATELSGYLVTHGNDTQIIYMDNYRENGYLKLRPGIFNKVYYNLTSMSKYKMTSSPYALHKIKKTIIRFKPDVIQIIQPLVRYIDNQGLFEMLGEMNIPCVYTMIDENAYLGDCDNAYDCQLFKEGCHNCKGQNFDINYQDFNGRWTAEGCRNLAIAKEKGYSSISNICFVAPQWVVERAEQSYLLKGRKFYVVDEYVNNNDIFVPRPVEEEKWLSLGIDTSKILILNVARFSNTRKGVRFYLDLARSMEDDDRYQFINVGFDGDRDEIPQNYVGIPFVSDQKELAEFYTLADLFMITSLSDTMPNACLEALSCGTPICGFDTTGIPYVAEYPLGQYVEPKNVEQLKQVVLSTNKKDEKMSKKCREYAMERFSPEVSGKNMLKIYNEMLTNQSKL